MSKSAEDSVARVRAIFGETIDLKSASKSSIDDSGADTGELITRVCYFYPQYTLETASQLTNDEVTALLIQADKQKAIEYYNLTLIAASPHTKKGVMVNKLAKQYKKIIES